MAGLPGPFDLVFIDADKPGYDAYFEAVLPKLAPRGVILADNTLQGGAGPRRRPTTSTQRRGRCAAFNDKLAADPRVVCALTTIRDGVTVIRRAGGRRPGLGPAGVLDYHLHLWPHTQSEVSLAVDQLAAYCERAQAAGVVEIAVTEHLFRFTQATDVVGRSGSDDEPSPALQASMADYWDFHARGRPRRLRGDGPGGQQAGCRS